MFPLQTISLLFEQIPHFLSFFYLKREAELKKLRVPGFEVGLKQKAHA